MAKKVEASSAESGTVRPKTVYRNQIETESHLFKAELAKCLKVDKFGAEKVKRVEHVHYFHSHNSQGKPMTQTAAVGGHVHEVTYSVDAEGNWVAKCGPPLKKVTKLIGGVARVKWERIKYKNPEPSDESGEDQWLTDEHTHEMTYRGSEVISTARVQEIQRSNQAQIGAGRVTAHKDAKVPEGFEMRDTDRAKTQE